MLTKTKRLLIILILAVVQEITAFSPLKVPIMRKRVPLQLEASASVSDKGKKWWKSAIASAGILAGTIGFVPVMKPALAADTAAVGKCLLTNCQKELAQCVLNPKCLANVVCLNACNGRKDEAECQIKCGDYFENDVVGTFNNCAVSQKKCVPQKQDEGDFPIPPMEAQVKTFDTGIWNGRWYISAGLNKAFDTFDCQVHFFTSPYPGKFYAKLFWRVNEPDGEFFTKDAIQRFIQDKQNPAHLINHDNDYLHYKDDWYILDYEKDNFVLVYYKGSNDAWDGYGGAFLYTRSPTVDPALIPRLETAMERTGKYKWSDFTLTDNTCKLASESPVVLREKFAKNVIINTEEQLQEALTSVRANAVQSIDRTEKGAEKSITFLEKEAEMFAAEIGRDVEAVEREVEKDLEEVEKDVGGFFGFGKKK